MKRLGALAVGLCLQATALAGPPGGLDTPDAPPTSTTPDNTSKPAGTASSLPPGPKPVEQHLGYAIDTPKVLVMQRLFGLAHGVQLLVDACRDLPDQVDAVDGAYRDWLDRQSATLDMLKHKLADYHFGSTASQANWKDIAKVLGLPDTIRPALKDVRLDDACETLPFALTQPRYALKALLKEADIPDHAPKSPVQPAGALSPESGLSQPSASLSP